ncbi:restriction endonuclease subunit S [Nafulsella turpanensis]|uniref:restriction endonuclease subunit S n=1 Tax=Nafulsella turpanensis TaxID=1265690 RepID=UPI00034CFC4A|nr:restriction endonuclease subunit S [Nafulsella turpanensis]
MTKTKAGYKPTKLGLIPEDWGALKFGDIVSLSQYGLSIPSNEDGTIPMFKMNNFLNGKMNPDKVDLVSINENDLLTYQLQIGDLLFNRTNSYDLVGKTGIFDLDGTYTFASYLVRFRIRKDAANPEFVNYFFNSSRTQTKLKALATVGVSQCNINPTNLKKWLVVPTPPLPEQKAIAACLGTWDKAIDTLSQLIAQKEQRKKGLMEQLLTGKKRLPGFSGEWREVEYGKVLKEVKRPVDWNDDELYDLISVKRRSGGLFHRESLNGSQILTKNLRTAKAGDFLISKMQIVHGASGLTTEAFDGMKISGSYIAAVAKDPNKLNVEFLDWISKLPKFYHQTYRSSYGVHIEKMTFDFKLFLKEKMQLPPLEEQQAIVMVLKASEAEITLLKQKMNQLKQQKKGLMQQLLTGKKRLV